MAKLLFCLVVLGTLAYASATFSSLQLGVTASDGQVEPFSITISKWLVNKISEKIVAIARFIQLKARLTRFLVSLYTTENLVLLRNLIEYGIKFGNFTLQILPTSVEDPGYWWIPTLTHVLNINFGPTGILGFALEQPAPSAEEDLTESPSENNEEIVTNPPIFFNEPAGTTEQPDSNEVSSDSIRESRSIANEEEHHVNEKNAEITEETGQSPDDILKKYEGRIMSLNRLINARRK